MKFSTVALLMFLVSGCAIDRVNQVGEGGASQGGALSAVNVDSDNASHEQLAENEVSEEPPRSILRYLPEYVYLSKPSNSSTAYALWVTHEEDSQYHVPWRIGGDWFVENSDQIIIDPVNKTISLGFDEDLASLDTCSQTLLNQERGLNGYSPCNSRFYLFKPIVKVPEPVTEHVPDQPRSFWQRLLGSDESQEADVAPVNKRSEVGKDSEVGKSSEMEKGAESGELGDEPELAQSEAAEGSTAGGAEEAYEATLDLDKLALTVVQLNLQSKARKEISGKSETLEAIESRLLAKIKASQQYFEQSLVNAQRKAIKQYADGATLDRLEIKKQTIDKSGYFNYDINWPAEVLIKPSLLQVEKVSYGRYLKEFKQFEVTDASEPLANLTLSKMKKQYLKDRRRIMQSLARNTSYYPIACPAPEFMGDYQVVVKCPEKIAATKEALSVTLVYEVLAKRFDLMIPRYTSYNNDLTIVADAQTLSLKNNSESHINVNQINWLANDAAQRVTRKTDKNTVIAIAKGQTVNIPLAEIVAGDLRKELEIPYLSKRQALRKHIDYGFDVSYQLVDGGGQGLAANRLNQTSRYNLNELLLSR